jgi:hypothetical protein
MSESALTSPDYEPPTIDGRDPIALPLIGSAISGTPQSAAFRPEPYVAPRIADRTAVDAPLVAFGSGPPPS